LEAYNKVELDIAGNGTHLAPWYAKLGFQPRPSIATTHTLSPEGGMVPCLQLVVTKEGRFSYLHKRLMANADVT
jgi:breast cancer 2 susceptibility protein